MKNQKNDSLIQTNFLSTTIILYCCEKVLVFMNIWLIGKNSMKHYYLKKKDSYSHLNMEDIAHANRVCKDFKIKHLGEYHDLFKVIDYC